MALSPGEKLIYDEPDVWDQSAAATGAIGPPDAAIWAPDTVRTIGAEDVRGSISDTDSILMALRFTLCLEPMIE